MKIRLIYIGRRIFDQDKAQIVHCFLDGKTERYWKGKYFLDIGNEYEAERKGKNVSIARWPKSLGISKKATEALKERWEAQDLVAKAFSARALAGRKAQRKAETYVRNNFTFCSLVRGMGYLEKRQFIEYLVDEIEKLEKKK